MNLDSLVTEEQSSQEVLRLDAGTVRYVERDIESIVIVVPMYNEAIRFDSKRFSKALHENGNLRFVLVNDGSNDTTLDVIEEFSEQHAGRVVTLSLEQNKGKAEAVRRGLELAIAMDAGLVGYWDADLATPLSAIEELRDQMWRHRSTEIVLASRVQLLGREIDREPVRHFVGRVFATLASLSLRLRVYDTQCGAKLFRNRQWLAEAIEQPFENQWAFDVELLSRYVVHCHFANQPIGVVELPLQRWVDVGGSKVRPTAALAAFASVVKIGWRQRRQMRSGVVPRTMATEASKAIADVPSAVPATQCVVESR